MNNTGRYKPYPAYKDSGVEYLGGVPEGWDVLRLRFLSKINPAASELFDLEPEDEVSFISMEDVCEYGGMNLTQVKPLEDIGNGYTYFRDGDVVFAKITPCFENGKGSLAEGLINGTAFGTTELHVVRPEKRLNKRFLFYLTISNYFRETGESAMYGAGGQKRVPTDFVKDFPVPISPLPEQTAIAAFLDRETAKIDALIAKKQRLIELLTEKRAAVISHAVTKGLNPNAPMKDSGVEWLGEVPEHWEVVKTRRLFDFVTSGSRGWAQYYSDDGEIFFRITNLSRDSINILEEDIRRVDAPSGSEGERSRIKKNDLLISITADLGSIAVATDSFEGGYVSQHVALARPGWKVHFPRWLGYACLARQTKDQFAAAGYGGTKIQLSLDDIRDVWIACPPSGEQGTISDDLDDATHKLDTLITQNQQAIIKLKEYRATLITAAVTGKIDVREEIQEVLV